MGFIDIIITPFSWLLTVFYNFTSDYGLAIILFALVVKVVLFPTSMKSKKSMIQMNMLSGQLDQLKKQYGKDQARYNQEMQKLYEREKVNPMGGCLWSFLPLLILLPLYSIIRMPLKYMMGMDDAQMVRLADALNWGEIAAKNGWIKEAAAFDPAGGYNQLYLASLIKEESVEALSATVGEGANLFAINFNFLGIDLAAIPEWKLWTLESFSWAAVIGPVVLVIFSTLLSVVMGMVSNKTNQLSRNQQNNSTNKTMMLLMPLMSLWIGFAMPAAMCIYWIANSVFSMLQEILAAKLLKKDYEKARVAAEERAKRLKEEEKERKEQARKKGIKSETESDGVNKDDSREGLRAHARGRAYIPDRFGGVTEYTDPDTLVDPQDKKAKKQNKTVSDKVDLTDVKDKNEPADQKQDTEERE